MAELQRGADRVLRIEREPYKGKHYTHIREWFRSGEEWRPGKGATLKDDELPHVLAALTAIAAEVSR